LCVVRWLKCVSILLMNMLTRPHLTLYLFVFTLTFRVTGMFWGLIFYLWCRKWNFFAQTIPCGIPCCLLRYISMMLMIARMPSLKSESTWANPPEYVLILAIFTLSYQSQRFQHICDIIESPGLKHLDHHHHAYLRFEYWLSIIIFFKNVGCRLL